MPAGPDGCPPGGIAALGPHFPDASDVAAGPPALAFSAAPGGLNSFPIMPCESPGVACTSNTVIEAPPTTDPSPGGGGTFPGVPAP